MALAINSKPMELEGNLHTFQLPDILRFLAMGRMTGTLTLASGRSVDVAIKEGRLVGISAPGRILKLGQLLVYSGLISRRCLDEVLESQQDDNHGYHIGEILIGRKLVTRERVEQALRHQLTEELWELFSWTDGSFKFDHGATAVMERALVSLEIEPLLAEGLRQMEQWQTIAGALNNPEEVFRVRPDLLAPPESRLSPNVWRVLSLINGRYSIRMINNLGGLGKFETLSALDRLLSLQLIEPVRMAPRRPSASAGSGELKLMTSVAGERNGNSHGPAGEAGDENSGKRSGLLGLRKGKAGKARENGARAADEPGAGPVGSFQTSVGLACALLNRLIGRLCLEPDFNPEGDAPRFTENLWKEVGMRFPRADLIGLREGRFDPALYERYVERAGGVTPALTGCHEDGMEAMAMMGQHLAELARERLGERATRMINEVGRPYMDKSAVTYPADFIPRSWLSQWLKT